MYLKANYNTPCPSLFVTCPKAPLRGLELATSQLGWLRRSKISSRNCTRCASVTGMFLRIPASQLQKPGLRRPFRCCTPNVCVWTRSKHAALSLQDEDDEAPGELPASVLPKVTID